MLVIVIARKATHKTTYPPQTFQDPFVSLDDLSTISQSQYIHYPLAYDPVSYDYNGYEQARYSFLGRPSLGMEQFDLYQCYRRRVPRQFIGLSPQNEFTEEILEQLLIWCKRQTHSL